MLHALKTKDPHNVARLQALLKTRANRKLISAIHAKSVIPVIEEILSSDSVDNLNLDFLARRERYPEAVAYTAHVALAHLMYTKDNQTTYPSYVVYILNSAATKNSAAFRLATWLKIIPSEQQRYFRSIMRRLHTLAAEGDNRAIAVLTLIGENTTPWQEMPRQVRAADLLRRLVAAMRSRPLD